MSNLNRKVFVIGAQIEYINWMQSEPTDRIEDADFVCATGGEDVDSRRYGKRSHPSSYCNPARDAYEFKMFDKAHELDKPLIGICRGSQALCVYAGGKLVQDQQNRHFWHPLQTISGKTIWVTSTHHQAQNPWNLPPDHYKILGWTTGQSSYHWGEFDGDEMVIGIAPENKEVEECWYPKINALALQHHPEMAFGDEHSEALTYIAHCRSLLDRFLKGAL